MGYVLCISACNLLWPMVFLLFKIKPPKNCCRSETTNHQPSKAKGQNDWEWFKHQTSKVKSSEVSKLRQTSHLWHQWGYKTATGRDSPALRSCAFDPARVDPKSQQWGSRSSDSWRRRRTKKRPPKIKLKHVSHLLFFWSFQMMFQKKLEKMTSCCRLHGCHELKCQPLSKPPFSRIYISQKHQKCLMFLLTT